MKETEINLLSEILPNELCKKVCNILHIDMTSQESKEVNENKGI